MKNVKSLLPFQQSEEVIGAKTLFKMVKDKPDSTFCTSVHEKGKKELLLCKAIAGLITCGAGSAFYTA